MFKMYQKQEGQSAQFTTFDLEKKTKVQLIQPNSKLTVVDYQGCGIINRMWLTFPGWFWQHWDINFPIDQTILKHLIIRIYWDNSTFPSVESPVGDFFGIGHCEYKHYLSKYLSMSSGGFSCYFEMPFKSGVKIEVENTHDTIPVDLFMNINYRTYEKLEDIAYFHCQYSQGTNNGYEPMVLLDTQGAGHYVGCALSMQGKDKGRMYYLEAPESFYIDNEEKPSIYGTGLEDYFNGGWYFRDGEFAADLYGAPIKDSLNSIVSMYRIHEEDCILFKKSIKLVFDNPITSLDLREFKFSSTSYYYLNEPKALTYKLPEKEHLVDVYRMRDIDHLSIP